MPTALAARSLPTLVFGLAFGCASTGIPEEGNKKLLTVAWPVDNLARVGGYPMQVVGAPDADAAEKNVCFDGKDDALMLPVAPLTEQTTFSIEALVKAAPTGHKTQAVLHIEDAFADTRTLIELHRQNDGRWQVQGFMRNKIDQVKLEPANSVIGPGEWHWLGLTFGGGMLRLYIDGRAQAESKMALHPMGNGSTAIGARLNREHWFHGCVKELRFANDALPADRLARVN